MDEKIKEDIKNQIEYYLSDKNLEGDEFFHNLISKDKDGYLDLEHILQCNKVKKENWTKEQILDSLKNNENIEIDLTKTKIRRKNNKPLPPLDENKLLARKRNREKNTQKKNFKTSPIIISITSEKESNINSEIIQSKFISLNPTFTILFTTFNKKEGHIVIIPSNDSNDIIDKNFTNEFDIEGNIFKLKICEGEELKKFIEENKSKIDNFLNQNKNKKSKKKKKTNTTLNESVILGDIEYNDLGIIKEKIKEIMDQGKEKMVVLNEEQTKFIRDLVQFHPDKKIRKKTEEIPFIGVGKLVENEPKRGFFGLDENKEKQYNFLIYKCPERIMTEDRKKK